MSDLTKALSVHTGQDDRVCAFTTLKGIFAVENPKKTALAILVDKEEIGSTGNTGMLSAFFEMTLAEIIERLTATAQLPIIIQQ